MINLEQLKADRRRGTDGPWTWGKDSHGFHAHLEPGVLGTDEYEPLNMSVADADRIARLPELEAAYIEAVELLEIISKEPTAHGCRMKARNFLQEKG